MKRKLVEQGGTTLMVSLPSKWAKKFKLKKGDEIEVIESGDVLCLSTDKETVSGEAELDVSLFETKKHVAHHFVPAYYRAGVDSVNLITGDDFDLGRLKDFLLKGTIGFEIIHQGNNSLLIKTVAKGIDAEFDPLLRRAFLLIKSLQEESLEMLSKGRFSDLKLMLHYDETLNRLTNICQRSLSKGLAGYERKTFIHYIVCELEKIGDEYKWLFNYLVNLEDGKLSKETLKIYRQTNELFFLFYDSFYKRDLNKISGIYDKINDLINESIKLITKSKSKAEIITLHFLMHIIKRIYSSLSPTISLFVEIYPLK